MSNMSKIRTNKYLNNDITKLDTILLNINNMKAFTDKKPFLNIAVTCAN